MKGVDIVNRISEAIQTLLSGDPSPLSDPSLIMDINKSISYLIEKDTTEMDDNDVALLGDIIHIGNIVYNNVAIPDDELFIDNGVYDILLERYRVFVPNVQVGAEPIQFKVEPKPAFRKKNVIDLVSFLPSRDDILFDELYPRAPKSSSLIPDLVTFRGDATGKRMRVVSHGNPSLVGTLDKCKFVTDKDAEAAGVLDDPSVKVFERDFIGQHIAKGIISPDDKLAFMAELKYDGVSVVVTIKNRMVVSAVSRGDTGMDKAVDYTPIFYGYRFPDLPDWLELDVKCEAVMTYEDLYKFNEVRGYNYANARTAIIGLTGLNDGYKYRDFVTLVPLKIANSSLPNNHIAIEEKFDSRIEEAEFINLFLATKVPLIYAVIPESNLTTYIYMVRKFVDDAEAMRPYINVMYDGVVISYLDKYIIEKLGRENSVNKYQMAIKFPTLKRTTKLLGISYTIGQNGVITPMAHYQPIEFLGTIHTKSSISSVKRFNENQFKIGNDIQVEYRNDVMPYVSTPPELARANEMNPHPVIGFITHCPACGQPLVFTDKSASCVNQNCPGRVRARMANMMAKLGLKGFAEANMAKLDVTSLRDLSELTVDEATEKLNSRIIAQNLVDSINLLKTTKVYDWVIIGALGFTSIAQGTWKKIFQEITLDDLLFMSQDPNFLYSTLVSIKGIGKTTAETICNEFPIYLKDIILIKKWGIVINSKGVVQKKIRVSGFRDPELMEQLNSMGYDASDKGVTKDTFILLIPGEGYTSGKLSKVGPDTKVIPVEEFKNNMEKYLV